MSPSSPPDTAFDQEYLKAQLADLVALPAAAQHVALDAMAATHPLEVQQLRSLLGHVAPTGPALAAPGALLEHMTQASLPTQIGPWAILGELGRGGMGVVLRGKRSDGVFDKEVAIKVLPPLLSSGKAGERFVTEARLLAPLDHPHIARLMDAGVAQGCAYFVMDLVEGTTLTAHGRTLALPARLRLFLQLCSAVAFAHGRLLVHRDIKPANVLVDARGQVRLLDFGIAKLLGDGEAAAGADGSALTGGLTAAFTPAYASPEQLTGEPPAVTSDVFSLGVLLYELCTGVHPFLGEGGETARQTAPTMFAVLQRNPAREPLQRAGTPPDLQSVLFKALEKEPAQRYSSVDALAADLEAYLGGLPVKAQPATWRYQASRFVARHRGAVSAAAATSLTIVGLAVWSLYSANVARAQEALATKRLATVRELANKVVFEYNRALEPINGTLAVRKTLATDALGYLEAQRADAGADAGLQSEIARGFEAVGDVLGRGVTGSNLGDMASAAASFTKAVALRQTICTEQPSLRVRSDEAVPVPACAALARALNRLGQNQFSQAQLVPAIASFEAARAANAQVLAAPQAWNAADLAVTEESQFLITSQLAGLSVRQSGAAYAKGLPAAREQLALAKRLALARETPQTRKQLRDSHDFLAFRLLAAGEAEAGLVEIEQAVSLAEAAYLEAANADTAIFLASSLSNRAELRAHVLQMQGAQTDALASLEFLRTWHAEDPKNAHVRGRYANMGARVGNVLNLIDTPASHALSLRLLGEVALVSGQFTPADGVFWVQHQRVQREAAASAFALGDVARTQQLLSSTPQQSDNPRAALDAAPAQLLRAQLSERAGDSAAAASWFALAYRPLLLQAEQTPSNVGGVVLLARACQWAASSKALGVQPEYAACAAKWAGTLASAKTLTPLQRKQLGLG